MPNVFKYAPGATAPGTLKKGDFLIGNNTADYGGTYYTGITPVTGGYTIYQNKPTGGPAINYAINDAEMIQYTFLISNQSFATGPSALNWYNTQSDKVVVNMDYEPITTSGLVLNLDAGFTPSYPKGGSGWYDLGPSGLTGQLINSPTFSSGNGGVIVFDGTDDYAQTSSNSGISGNNPYTFEIFLNVNPSEIGSGRRGWFIWQGLGSQSTNQLIGLGVNNSKIEIAHWANDTTYTNSTINFGNWQHIVTTFSGGTERLYINGINTDTKNIGSLNIVNGKITLAAVPGDSSSVNTLNCQIGVHRIYNRALSGSEILQNYNAQKGRFGL